MVIGASNLHYTISTISFSFFVFRIFSFNTLRNEIKASFIALDPAREGLPKQYLALIQCDDELLIREVCNVGDRGTLSWSEPYAGTEDPEDWAYIVKPSLPYADCPGNLVLQIKRPKNDESAIPYSRRPHKEMETETVWACPSVSDASPRRLVACAKLIAEEIIGPTANELRRYAQALDLKVRNPESQSAKRAAKIFPRRDDPDVSDEIKALFHQFSAAQTEAYDYVVEMAHKHSIVLLQGPPGTGKTAFISILLQIAWHTKTP